MHENCTTIFTVNTDYQSELPVIQHNLQKKWQQYPQIRPEVYVLDVTNQDLHQILNYLQYYTFFNPAALFIMIVDNSECEIKEILLDFFIYTYIFIDNSSTYPKIISCGGIEKELMVEESVKKKNVNTDWMNSTFQVGIGHSPPFVIQESSRGRYKGLDIDIVDFIATKMELKVVYKPSLNFVGSKKNFRYNGALGMLSNKSADMVMGGMFATKDSSMDFTVSYPIHRTTYSWFVPGPISIPFWKRMLLIYEPSVSFAISLFYILMTVLQFSYNRIILKKGWQMYNESFKLYTAAIGATMKVSQTEEWSKKMLYLCWFLFWLILNASFTSKILQCLIRNKYEFPINSIEDLNKANLEVCILTGLEFTLTEYTGKVITCTECGTCLDRTAFQKDLVTVRNTDLVDYYKSEYYSNDQGDPLIHALKEKYFAIYNVMIFRKNHPVFKKFNEILRRLITSGVLASFRRKYETTRKKETKINGWRSLELNPLKFVFNFWGYGLVLSFLVFIAEIIIVKCDISYKYT